MGRECQQCDDTYDKINSDTLVLTDKVIDFNKRIMETPTPWYHIRAQWRLYKEHRSLIKQTDDIGKRLKRLEESPVQIVKRT